MQLIFCLLCLFIFWSACCLLAVVLILFGSLAPCARVCAFVVFFLVFFFFKCFFIILFHFCGVLRDFLVGFVLYFACVCASRVLGVVCVVVVFLVCVAQCFFLVLRRCCFCVVVLVYCFLLLFFGLSFFSLVVFVRV